MTSAAVAQPSAAVASPDLVIELARFAAAIDAARLDPAVVKAVKTNILDTLSCALAGSSAKAIAEVSGLVREWGGAPQADMLVFGGKFPAHHAAWVNSGMSHARDYDDTHAAAIAGIRTSSIQECAINADEPTRIANRGRVSRSRSSHTARAATMMIKPASIVVTKPVFQTAVIHRPVAERTVTAPATATDPR